MNTLVLDFETYYDNKYSLRRLMIVEYVHGAKFHVHGLAIRHPDGRAEFRTDVPNALAGLQEQYGAEFESVTVLCHNSYFDFYVLFHYYGVSVRHFVDTMLLSFHVNGKKSVDGGTGAALKDLAAYYGLQNKGDLDFMCGVRNPDPMQMAELESYALGDVEITYQLALRLLPQVSNPKVELPLLQHTVRLFVEREISVDVAGLESLRQEVEEYISRYFQRTGGEMEEVGADKRFNELLKSALARTGRLVPLKKSKNGPIPAIAKKDTAMLNMLNDADPAVQALVKARLDKKSADQLVARLDTLQRIITATGGLLPPCLIYYAAHTGRFGGGQRFNLQNLGSKGLGRKVRHLLKAKPGCLLVVGDFCQIEARVLAWQAGETDLLVAFEVGRDLYSEFASCIFNRSVTKPTSDMPEEEKKQMSALRQVGKQAILGLGYNMGALRFMDERRGDPLTSSLFTTGALTPRLCRRVVDAYRSRFPKICEMWCRLEQYVKLAYEGGRASFGGLDFWRQDDAVHLRLPSTRELLYANIRLVNNTKAVMYLDKNGQKRRFFPDTCQLMYGKDTNLYGGKICENVVQAIARDIMVEALLRLEQDGWRVLFHVHDEIVLEVPEDASEAAKAEMQRQLEAEVPWAPGLPISAEVKVMQYYDK